MFGCDVFDSLELLKPASGGMSEYSSQAKRRQAASQEQQTG